MESLRVKNGKEGKVKKGNGSKEDNVRKIDSKEHREKVDIGCVGEGREKEEEEKEAWNGERKERENDKWKEGCGIRIAPWKKGRRKEKWNQKKKHGKKEKRRTCLKKVRGKENFRE